MTANINNSYNYFIKLKLQKSWGELEVFARIRANFSIMKIFWIKGFSKRTVAAPNKFY